MDDINILTVYVIMLFQNKGPYQGNPPSSGRGGNVVLKNGLFKKTNIIIQMCVKVMELITEMTTEDNK